MVVQEKFPHVSVENITGLIGGFFLLRFINPAIVFPHSKLELSFKAFFLYILLSVLFMIWQDTGFLHHFLDVFFIYILFQKTCF